MKPKRPEMQNEMKFYSMDTGECIKEIFNGRSTKPEEDLKIFLTLEVEEPDDESGVSEELKSRIIDGLLDIVKFY